MHSPRLNIEGPGPRRFTSRADLIDNARYFEGDGSDRQPAPHRRVPGVLRATPEGTVPPLEGPGIGVDVDEEYIRAHPITEGPAWR